MRVVHLIYKLTQGGAEKVILDLTKNLLNQDIDVAVGLLNDDDDFYSDLLKEAGVPVIRFRFSNRFDFVSARRMAKELRNYDIVHVHLFPALYIAAFLKMLGFFRGRLIYTEHSTHNKRRNIRWMRWVEEIVYKQYQGIVAISPSVRNALLSWVPSLQTTSVISNGVEVDTYRNASAAVDVLEWRGKHITEICVVLMVGALEQRKDQETLIRAIASLPPRYVLLLVGEGRKRAELEAMVVSLNCSERVRFLGFRRDVAAIMKACDLYVQSSPWEGFGLVAVEAMAAGLPVIASDVPGLSGVVAESGLLFPVGDSKALAKSILHAEMNNSTLSARGKIRAEEYGINAFVEKHIDLYKSL